MHKKRLTRQSWIEAGLKTLVKEGPSALAAEPMARKLGTTKGSFYWHFKDVPDYHQAIVKEWQTRAFADVVKALSEEGSVETRLRRFGHAVLDDPQDRSFRVWAQTNQRVASTVEQVDEERLTYVANLLRNMGIKNLDFAKATLGALVGMPLLPGKREADKAFDTMIDLVVALR